MADGLQITLRRHGNAAGPRLVLSHGNGLAADLYYPFWSLFTDRYDIILYDFRSHGWSPVGDRRVHNIPTLVRDSQFIVQAIDARFGEKPMVGVFHSLSALTALLHGFEEAAFSALVLFDPPVCPPGRAPEDFEVTGQQMAQRARQRQDRFATREEYADILRRSRAFARMQPGVLDLFAHTTLRIAAESGYELCCPREYEAQICEYVFGWMMRAHQNLARLTCPTIAIGSDPTVPYSFVPSMDLSSLAAMNYDFVPDTTHFLQLEKPEACAAVAIDFLESVGAA